jgi:hypothetical protein
MSCYVANSISLVIATCNRLYQSLERGLLLLEKLSLPQDHRHYLWHHTTTIALETATPHKAMLGEDWDSEQSCGSRHVS